MSDQFIGVDVGGTKIAVAVLEGGELSEARIVPTNQASQEALVEQLAMAIEGSVTEETRSVGIGMPSVIDFATGKILASVNIPLHDLPLRQLLTERVGVPVYVENDAGCAALAEAFEDGRITVPSLVMFTIGTGVGGGWVLNGRLYRGATTSAAEVGPHDHRPRPRVRQPRAGRPVPAARLAGDAGLGPRAGPAGRLRRDPVPRLLPGQDGRAEGRHRRPRRRRGRRGRRRGRRCGACASWASGSGSGSPTRSTPSIRWRS